MTTPTENPSAVQQNTVVQIHMTVYDLDGELLQSTEEDGPFTYIQGHENLIDKLEQALEGKAPGESCTIEVTPEEGYGDRVEEATIEVPRDALAEGMDAEVGVQVAAQGPDGPMEFTIIAVSDEEITLDANHPLAGKHLKFVLKVESVRAASAEEIEQGMPSASDEA